ncbi:MAG: threonine synthase [Myxococcales bacterium]|nr:threonine synthase [Myxococcales bacterium]
MRFFSTRNPQHHTSLTVALGEGLAPDGGLYIPEQLPKITNTSGEPAQLHQEAYRFLAPFFQDDALLDHLASICEESFTFPLPLRPVADNNRILELFHGPTAAFKDFGARFLSACFAHIALQPSALGPPSPRTILVATSGDTGGAVASAFAHRPDHQVWILFPEGGVSPLQEAQLTSWGSQVFAFAVDGSFDDCQRIAKEAFLRSDLRNDFQLTSANSINIGRLLPQASYLWAAAQQHWSAYKKPMKVIVPTGNLGHGLAALWAQSTGAPIEDIVFALNANRSVLDYLVDGSVTARPTIRTLANAMDVSLPSNLERLKAMKPPVEHIRAFSFNDVEISDGLRRSEKQWGTVVCPHTACAFLAREALGTDGWTILATAHPAKFRSIVEPLVDQPIPTPTSLAEILERSQRKIVIEPTLDSLINGIQRARSSTRS